MWFPEKAVSGHDSDEKIEVADLQRGLDVLLETLTGSRRGPPLRTRSAIVAAEGASDYCF